MIASAPLAETAERLRSGELTPTDYIERIRDRVRDVESEIQSFVAEPDWDLLDGQAAALVERFPEPAGRPPLFGVPVGIKDIFHVDGYPTRAGTALAPSVFDGPQAASVTSLRENGALVLGKTVTTEFAYMEPGPTRNPHDPNHTPGGSSSGSAAAVAAGLCPVALGSQTIGSVIRPASFCGIVGFKPSYGRIPIDGVLPLAESVDHVGVFTQDVEGMALVAAILCDDWRPLPEPTRTPTVGVPAGPYLEQAETRGLDAFEAQLGALEAAGYEITRVALFEEIDAINDRHTDLVAADAALAHHRRFESHGDQYAEASAELIREGRQIDVGRLASTRVSRTAVREQLDEAMAGHDIDVWVSPGAPGPAPEGIGDTGDPVMNLPWTHAGVPALTVPGGSVDGLPVGLQCTTRFGEDERLLQWSRSIAAAVEGAA